RRERAAAAFQRGIGCVLASQVVVNGKPTVWGAQHDPLTLAPTNARAYEHASLSGGESVDLMELLMGLPSPDARVVAAVHGAAAWFRATAINGFAYESKGELTPRAGAGPIWARFYEIGTNRPIFSDRDGVIRYNWSELGTERRYGYNWYTADAARALRRYDTWAGRNPVVR
ncbi:MAG TPA: pectate lyase, partial [Longimicrobium sp.]